MIDPAAHPDAICWHEAGHALVAHLQGADVRYLTLESDVSDLEGHAEIAWPGDLSDHERARRSARTALGGPIAELVFRGEDDLEDPAVLATWQADWLELERCLRLLTASSVEHDRLRRAFASDVRRTLADPTVRERLARIADMLSAHGALDATLFGDAVA